MITANFSSKDHNSMDGATTYWFTLSGTDYGSNKTFNNEMFGIVDDGTTKSVVDCDGAPINNEFTVQIVLRECKITDESADSKWLTLTEIGKDQMMQWLESVVRDFANQNHDIWIQRIEQTANNTAPNEDIVFEVRAIEAIDKKPESVKILRDCFTNG